MWGKLWGAVVGKLTDTGVRNAKLGQHKVTGEPLSVERFPDGNGLMLEVRPSGSKSWLLRLMKNGKRSDYGLGGYPSVSLAIARAKAAEIRTAVEAGRDPIADKKAAIAAERESRDRTFEKVARVVNAQRVTTETRTGEIWLGRMERFIFPKLGAIPIADIDGHHVIDALEPIWLEKGETARRMLQGVQLVLRRAHARGWRGPVPSIREMAKDGLPTQSRDVKHRAAVEYADAALIVAKLKSQAETAGRMALLFTIYTAARSGETRGATWGEFDLQAGLWTVPAGRMKMRREHVVPLSAAALAVLQWAMAPYLAKGAKGPAPTDLVFPGALARPLSDMTMSKALKAIAPDKTVHGWRSTFRDWAGETTPYPADVCEAALAHAINTGSGRAYQRGDLLAKRRDLMADWAAYLMIEPTKGHDAEEAQDAGEGGNVVAFSANRVGSRARG